MTRKLSPTALSNHLGCAHATTLEHAHWAERIGDPTGFDPTRELRVARGQRHERAYVDSLRAEGRTYADLNGKPVDATRDAIARGIDVIAQAALEHVDAAGPWFGRADVLVRVESASHYEVHDTKLANETRGGTLLQLALYSEWLAALQGVRPERFHVVMPSRTESFALREVEAYTRWALARFAIAAGREPSDEDLQLAPDPRPHCEICRWWKDCDTKRHDQDHLSLVAGLGRTQMRVLRDAGIATLEAFATRLDLVPRRPEHGAFESYERLHHQARVQLESRGAPKPKHELLDTSDEIGLGELPLPRPGDLFLDFEGCPFVEPSGREYLFGVSDVEDRYEHRWAWTAADERAAFDWLIELIAKRRVSDPSIHVYHFGAYEHTAVGHLGARWGAHVDDVDELFRNHVFVDLHAIVRRALRVGVESYSIKQLEPVYGLSRDAELQQSRVALRVVEEALVLGLTSAEVDPKSLDVVQRYNRDDCVSVRALRDWLESLRAERETALGRALPRPALPTKPPPKASSERNAKSDRLSASLRAGLPDDPKARSPEQAARGLLADLLSYHRREDSVEWWEYYRLVALDDDDALEDRAAITNLDLAPSSDDPSILRSTYPPQDVALRPGDTIHMRTPRGDENESRYFGTIHAIDRAARWVEIKPPGTAKPPFPTTIFAHLHVGSDAKIDRLQELAANVLAGVGGAAWDLLTRALPCGDAERTVLAIQGPPGTGKTHTGAQMIVEACRAGKRVGVTAMSHTAIRNMLDKIVEVTKDTGGCPRLAAKVNAVRDASGPVLELTTNAKAEKALANRTVDVMGGTTFFWCRPAARDHLDILFVDEAGQLSLADTLAVAGAAKSLVLLGDPQQLQQPCKASHPDGADVSALRHLLGDANTISPDRGIFLDTTWRLPPKIRRFTSHAFYDDRLAGRPDLERRALLGPTRFAGHGIWRVPVAHDGCSVRSIAEVDAIEQIVVELLTTGISWRDMDGIEAPLEPKHILVVAPYNAQVDELAQRLRPHGVTKVGTVDKFQGQQAPVVLWSMTSSTAEDAPRGLGFLYDGFRLNVATSRAKVVCIVVGNPGVFDVDCRTAADVKLVDRWCALAEHCEP